MHGTVVSGFGTIHTATSFQWDFVRDIWINFEVSIFIAAYFTAVHLVPVDSG